MNGMWKRVATAVGIAVVTAAGVLVGAGTASAAPPTGVTVRLVVNGQCASPSAVYTTDGSSFDTWDVVGYGGCGGGNDLWRIDDAGDGVHHRLVSLSTGRCAFPGFVLTPDGPVNVDIRDTVNVAGCGETNDLWRIDEVGPGQFRLVAASTGKCAFPGFVSTVDGFDFDAYDVLVQQDCGSAGNLFEIHLA